MQQLRLVTARGCVAAAVLGILFTFITLRLTLVTQKVIPCLQQQQLCCVEVPVTLTQHVCVPALPFPYTPPLGQCWNDAATHRPWWTAQLRITTNLHP